MAQYVYECTLNSLFGKSGATFKDIQWSLGQHGKWKPALKRFLPSTLSSGNQDGKLRGLSALVAT